MNVRKMMMIASLLFATACVKSGSVAEKQPVASLAAYKSASVAVDVPSSMTNPEKYKSAFANALTLKLREKKIFTDVTTEGGEVAIKVKVTKLDQGNSGLTAVGGNAGAAEIAASVELFDKENKAIGAFDVTGNSKKNMQTSVGGVNTAAMEDGATKAFEAAADEIVGYLEKKR